MSRNRGSSDMSLFMIVLALIGLLLFTGVSLGIFGITDDGSIGVNVTTGKLKVDIVDTESNSLVGDVLDFVNPDGNGKLYFQPGATYYTQGFRIKNIGTLALDYRMDISKDKNIDETAFAESFEFWITTDLSDLSKGQKLTSCTGKLESTQSSELYYLVVRMKETAGNEFQNKTYTGIGITVYAVQSDIEE